ncbi:hypothetical protein GTQ48_13600 [Alteromonas genovensis]|uniref:PEP-CTERM sorting domain-containing protein n=1 Tax=Alteromonas genovensis TaxID=471225 RepID=A0A6N9TPG4_9ALTE|nr:hypothetical protein [Alteromonas genovensis]NDW16548.1 hypothetical protein [Alteromonas genovensis]
MLNKIKKSVYALTVIALSASFSVNANLISFGNTIVNNPENFEGFDRSGATSIAVTDEFSSNGITFNAISGNRGPTANINGSCNVGGLTGSAWLMIGVFPSCSVDNEVNIVDMIFDATVTELSFLFRTNNAANYLYETFLGQTQQAQLNISRNTVGSATQFLFSGEFDRIRFTELTNSTWFWVDDVRWNATAVKAPETLLLFSLGLCAIVSLRRMKAI